MSVKKYISRALTTFYFGALLLFCSCDFFDREGLNPGSHAPVVQIELYNQSVYKNFKTLKDFRGKVLLLNFWASWCAPCLKEMKDLEALYTAIGSEDFVILAIALDDTKQAVQNFIKNNEVSFPVGLESQGIAKNKYQVTGFPETFILDKAGKIVLVKDPLAGLVSRIKGERSWSDPLYISLIRDLLSKNSNQ